MKITKILGLVCLFSMVSVANAANITIYHSPSCPHCHHARDFVEHELIYVYDTISVKEVNVMEESNRDEFFNTLKKCEYKTGGVPVMVIGEKCFQGYAESMNDEIRAAVEADLSAEQKQTAQANKKEFDKDKDSFVANHADRKNAISKTETDVKKNLNKTNTNNVLLFGFIILLVLGLGVVLFKKQK
jgi:glutaredoxin